MDGQRTLCPSGLTIPCHANSSILVTVLGSPYKAEWVQSYWGQRKVSSLVASSELCFFLFSPKEHIMMRNQNLVGFKLPELSEAAEQDKGRLLGLACPLSLPTFSARPPCLPFLPALPCLSSLPTLPACPPCLLSLLSLPAHPPCLPFPSALPAYPPCLPSLPALPGLVSLSREHFKCEQSISHQYLCTNEGSRLTSPLRQSMPKSVSFLPLPPPGLLVTVGLESAPGLNF